MREKAENHLKGPRRPGILAARRKENPPDREKNVKKATISGIFHRLILAKEETFLYNEYAKFTLPGTECDRPAKNGGNLPCEEFTAR